jgi:acyl dehydratase
MSAPRTPPWWSAAGPASEETGRVSVSEQVKFIEVEPGTELAQQSYPVSRLSLVKYCGASGDFNVIHWNERIARSVGLPNVIAHGMFTMAQAGRYVTDWAGHRAELVEFGVRFSSMVVVPDDDAGATVEISGQIEEKLDGNRVVLALTARSGEAKVLTRARAVVRLP